MCCSDGQLKEEQLGELTVPLKSRPTRYALARFLASVELPPSTAVSRLVPEDEAEASGVSNHTNSSSSSSSSSASNSNRKKDGYEKLPAHLGPLSPIVMLPAADNGVRGHIFALRESLQQQLDIQLPPADVAQRHAVHARFTDYWCWPRGSNEAPKPAEEKEIDPFEFHMEEVEDEEIVVLLAGDGFPLTESPQQSLTLLRFGFGNLRVLQQSCDAWPLLGIIDAAESNEVVRSSFRAECGGLMLISFT